MESENLELRLAVLEKIFEERWKTHDADKIERFGRIEMEMSALAQKIDLLAGCPDLKQIGINTNKISDLRDSLRAIWASIASIIVAIIMAFFAHLMKAF